MTQNTILDDLIQLGICNTSSIQPLHPKVRDRDDVSVLKCSQSDVIFLSRTDHMDIRHYAETEDLSYWSSQDRKQAINTGLEDKLRRKELLQHIVSNKAWLDIGTGAGGILDELNSLTRKTAAVEPQKAARETLTKLGYEVFPDINSVSDNNYEIVSLFHVFEHFTNPIEELTKINQLMAPNAKIIIEVPHARDFLISFLDLEEFKDFTFWSEHLLLHTRQSLKIFLEEAGFQQVCITGCQRYPLANHLHWIHKKQPGGHNEWSILRSAQLDEAYSNMLSNLDMNDTLIAIAST